MNDQSCVRVFSWTQEYGQLTFCAITLPGDPHPLWHLLYWIIIFVKCILLHLPYTNYKPFMERYRILFICFPSTWPSSWHMANKILYITKTEVYWAFARGQTGVKCFMCIMWFISTLTKNYRSKYYYRSILEKIRWMNTKWINLITLCTMTAWYNGKSMAFKVRVWIFLPWLNRCIFLDKSLSFWDKSLSFLDKSLSFSELQFAVLQMRT